MKRLRINNGFLRPLPGDLYRRLSEYPLRKIINKRHVKDFFYDRLAPTQVWYDTLKEELE